MGAIDPLRPLGREPQDRTSLMLENASLFDAIWACRQRAWSGQQGAGALVR
jgi:hypothetical protein